MHLSPSLSSGRLNTWPREGCGRKLHLGSDIWSLGLTLHAVAVGKYPYRDLTSDPEQQQLERGGKLDYWTLLHSIQESPVPLPPSPPFTEVFVNFISQMCVKGPRQRMSASDLTKHDFVDKAKVPDKNKKCAHLDLTPMMSAAEAASIANAWATYAANALHVQQTMRSSQTRTRVS